MRAPFCRRPLQVSPTGPPPDPQSSTRRTSLGASTRATTSRIRLSSSPKVQEASGRYCIQTVLVSKAGNRRDDLRTHTRSRIALATPGRTGSLKRTKAPGTSLGIQSSISRTTSSYSCEPSMNSAPSVRIPDSRYRFMATSGMEDNTTAEPGARQIGLPGPPPVLAGFAFDLSVVGSMASTVPSPRSSKPSAKVMVPRPLWQPISATVSVWPFRAASYNAAASSGHNQPSTPSRTASSNATAQGTATNRASSVGPALSAASRDASRNPDQLGLTRTVTRLPDPVWRGAGP
jgi:hypothetical protein